MTSQRRDLLRWMLAQEKPGEYALALLRMQQPVAVDFNQEVKNLEIRLIREAMMHAGGNVAKASDLLHLRRTTLSVKLERLRKAHGVDLR